MNNHSIFKSMGCSIILLIILVMLVSNPALAQRSYRLDKAPFYKTIKKHQVKSGATIIHLPVMIDEKVKTEFFYLGREAVLLPVAEVMNQYIDSLAWSTPLTINPLPTKGAPYVFVGSSEAETAPPGAEMMREEFDTYPPMMTYVQKPSKEWMGILKNNMAKVQADYAVVMWLGFNEYPKSNKGLFKKKVVLGTGYEPEIRFLSAVDEPVEVLQVTAMLIDKEGEVLRVGSEAFLHEDTPFWAQVLELDKSINDKAIEQAITSHRREDLPGRPLAWKMGLHTLMEQTLLRPGQI